MGKLRNNAGDKNKKVAVRVHSARYNRRMVYYFRKLRGEYLLKDESIFEKTVREYGNKCIMCRASN